MGPTIPISKKHFCTFFYLLFLEFWTVEKELGKKAVRGLCSICWLPALTLNPLRQPDPATAPYHLTRLNLQMYLSEFQDVFVPIMLKFDTNRWRNYSHAQIFLSEPGGRRREVSNTISTQNLWNLFENRPFFDKTKALSTALHKATIFQEPI